MYKAVRQLDNNTHRDAAGLLDVGSDFLVHVRRLSWCQRPRVGVEVDDTVGAWKLELLG